MTSCGNKRLRILADSRITEKDETVVIITSIFACGKYLFTSFHIEYLPSTCNTGITPNIYARSFYWCLVARLKRWSTVQHLALPGQYLTLYLCTAYSIQHPSFSIIRLHHPRPNRTSSPNTALYPSPYRRHHHHQQLLYSFLPLNTSQFHHRSSPHLTSPRTHSLTIFHNPRIPRLFTHSRFLSDNFLFLSFFFPLVARKSPAL